jgi:hypothetical protein
VAHRWNRPKKTVIASGLTVLVAGVLSPWGGPSVVPAAAASAAPAPTTLLLPDLVAMRAQDLHISRNGTTRKLRFESGLGNVGEGPVEVRPDGQQDCPEGKHHASQILYRDVDGNGRYALKRDTRVARRSAGCMVFHPYHNHWHFEAASRYTIFRPNRPERTIVAQRKMSFCLRDSERVPAAFGKFRYAEHYGACSRYSPQGISVGWVDVYQSYLAGQALELPRWVGDGLYCLRIRVDPKNQLVETRDKNNSSVRAFSLRGDKVIYRDSARCRPKA